MTRSFRYTLLTDGASDECLRFPIDWLLREHGFTVGTGEWADLRVLVDPPKSLSERISEACRLYTCDLLFVHRDAEAEPPENRIREIEAAIGDRSEIHVCVVPVRMVEAWLLHDEAAIRRAAGNPNGRAGLDLPRLADVEKARDPKALLKSALLSAAEDRGRRRQRAARDFGINRRRVAEIIDDYSPLRRLSAFAAFEERLVDALGRLLQ